MLRPQANILALVSRPKCWF